MQQRPKLSTGAPDGGRADPKACPKGAGEGGSAGEPAHHGHTADRVAGMLQQPARQEQPQFGVVAAGAGVQLQSKPPVQFRQ